MVEIQEQNFDAFFEAPFEVYRRGTAYVSPLKGDLERFLSASNPLVSGAGQGALTFFTAHRGNRVLGRITAHEHGASNALHGLKMGYFGYFDCADDALVAKALLARAEDWCRARGLDTIAGNFNLTAMQQIGVVTDGFDHAPYLDQVWSPPWLPALLEGAGYARTFPMATMEVADIQSAPAIPLGPKQLKVIEDPDFTFAPITRATLSQRLEEARTILNASFADNPMFVPVSAEEFHFQAKDMKWVMDKRISAVLHHRGKPAGAIICVPDMNPFLRRIRSRIGLSTPWHFLRHRMTNTRAVLIFAGIMPHLQGQGINPVILAHVMENAKSAGYTSVGNTWIADVNPMSLAQAEKAGSTRMHRLHLFSKKL
ncbi:MAG: GNAT family N-acetyltransferase [Pseudomonadota bacterium]